jgi:hypothetical protein
MKKIDMEHCCKCGEEFEERPGMLLFYTLVYKCRFMRACNKCFNDPEVQKHWMPAMGGNK